MATRGGNNPCGITVTRTRYGSDSEHIDDIMLDVDAIDEASSSLRPATVRLASAAVRKGLTTDPARSKFLIASWHQASASGRKASLDRIVQS